MEELLGLFLYQHRFFGHQLPFSLLVPPGYPIIMASNDQAMSAGLCRERKKGENKRHLEYDDHTDLRHSLQKNDMPLCGRTTKHSNWYSKQPDACNVRLETPHSESAPTIASRVEKCKVSMWQSLYLIPCSLPTHACNSPNHLDITPPRSAVQPIPLLSLRTLRPLAMAGFMVFMIDL